MIDADLKVWVIEINTNPCLEESSPILEELLPRMLGKNPDSYVNLIKFLPYIYLDDAFKLTIDKIFP